MIILLGILLLIINTYMVKLSDFAQEVESGEFEKKVLDELDEE
jgi:hypothetical protein